MSVIPLQCDAFPGIHQMCTLTTVFGRTELIGESGQAVLVLWGWHEVRLPEAAELSTGPRGFPETTQTAASGTWAHVIVTL